MPPSDKPTVDLGLHHRVLAFVRGELTGQALADFELELDRDPTLQEAVARAASDVTVSGSTIQAPGPVDGRALSGDAHDRHLRRGGLLGRGGMAIVYSATQTHLGREVAVKTLPPGADAWARAKLVHEARVTGYLEHPGIVPVHDLIEDELGDLQVVLKRVEGQSWAWLMAHPADVKARFETDPLDWHVSVAINVCRALQFAHERGVVHRDVKPANVMVGRFGEVYLLDWGVAGTLKRDARGLLPCVGDAPFAGTLNCMAPEQLTSDLQRLGPCTDTFLLGGSLFQALWGRPPFAQLSLEQRQARPEAGVTFPAGSAVTSELEGIVRKALEVDPARRFQSADLLRRALEEYLQHRDARRLAQRAAQRAAEARRAWAAGGDPRQAEQAAADAEFGYRAALELWPDDEAVRSQREALSTDRVRFVASQGATQVASWLLGGLEAPPPTLVTQVEGAVKVEHDERQRLTRIALEGDRRFGLRTRRALLAGFGLAWLGFWWATALSVPASAAPVSTFLLVYLGAGFAVMLPMRRVMLEHRLNREMVLVQGAMTAVSAALSLAAPALSLSVPTLLVVLMFVWALGMGAVAAIVEPASAVPSLTWLGCALVSAHWPSALPVALALGAAVHVTVPLLVSLRVKSAPP